ncbi:MAG TPA: protein kinase [Bryobacteraceae bacterium]|nr:protein kinase [Bryobacteraceae bacterium]
METQWLALSRAFHPRLQSPSLLLEIRFPWTFSPAGELPSQDCPELLAIHAVVEGESPSIVLSDFEGESLARLLARETLAPERAIALLRRLAAALDHLHACGLTHGALHPASILLGEADSLRIVDWAVGWNHLPLRYLSGAAEYLSPERLAGNAATGRADQFALGVLAHCLLDGRHPFPGGIAEKLFRIRYGMPDQDLFGQTNFAPHAIYERAFSADPAKRFASCAAMIRELESVPRRRSYSETRLIAKEDETGAQQLVAESRGQDEAAAAARNGTRFSRWWAAAAALALLALGLGFADWRLQGRIGETAAQTEQVSAGSAASALEGGSFRVCSLSPGALHIRELAVAYWNADRRLVVFNSTAYTPSGWTVPPGAASALSWSPGGNPVWNGAVLFYFASVQRGGQEFVVSGRWDGTRDGCLHLD